MRERIDEMVGYGSESVWVSTFHSTCVRILRRFIDTHRIMIHRILPSTMRTTRRLLMKDICKRLQIDTKIYKERMFLNVISHAKDELIDPDHVFPSGAGRLHKTAAGDRLSGVPGGTAEQQCPGF